jgi:hypothetical protein
MEQLRWGFDEQNCLLPVDILGARHNLIGALQGSPEVRLSEPCVSDPAVSFTYARLQILVFNGASH